MPNATEGIRAGRPDLTRSPGLNVWSNTHMSTAEAVSSCAGFALGALYLLTLMFGNAAGLEGDCLALVRVVAAASGAAVLVALAFSRPERQGIFLKLPSAAVLSAVLAAGTALLALTQVASGLAATAVEVVAALVIGTSGALTLVQMGCYFTRLYIPDAATCSITGVLVALFAYLFLFAHLVTPWGLAAAVLLPLANIAVCRVMAAELPGGLDFDPRTTFRARADEWPLFLYKVALPFFCMGSVLTVLLARLHNVTVAAFTPAALMGLVLAAVVIYLVITSGIAGLRRQSQSYAQLFAMIMPLVALTAIPLYSMEASAVAPVNLGALATACLLVALGWTFLCSASLEYLLSPVSVYALGLGSLALGGAVGGGLALLFEGGSMWLFSILCALCLLMCLGLVPANPVKDLSRSSYAGDETEGDEPADQDGDAANADDAPLDTDAEKPGYDAPGHPEHGKGRFMRRCEYAANLYQLSPRELDVLTLLAKGRSMAYVQEALYVSEGTAKTHIRHIYRKMNVHSRHELVELIESIDVP